MSGRTLRIDLEIFVRDLTPTEAAENGFEDGCEGEVNETDPFEVAEAVVALFHEEAIAEAFAGTAMGVTFDMEPLVIAAEWVPEKRP